MERHGFIHDMLDVKVLILYIMSRAMYPVDLQKIYELSYQDDGLILTWRRRCRRWSNPDIWSRWRASAM